MDGEGNIMKILFRMFKSIIKPDRYSIATKMKAENYAHTLDSLIDDRDDDLAKILVPIKNFLLNISNK
jgi:hypothetical protein